jgi:phage terminase large subunit-like protein
MPSAEATFRNLYLNQRVDRTQHFLSPSVWQACGEEPDEGVFRRGRVFAGLDLSAKNDLTALVLVCGDEDGVYHVKPHFWAPADGIRDRANRDRAPYDVWAKQGHIEAKPGRTIDYGWVARKIGELDAKYHLEALKFDRWRVDDLEREMSSAGVDCYVYGRDWKEGEYKMPPPGIRLVPHGQGYQDMNPAVEIVEDLVSERNIRHGRHPVLTYCASNTVVQQDPAGNRKFAKDKAAGRIDGMVAMAMALNGAVSIVQQEPSIYETRGVIAL